MGKKLKRLQAIKVTFFLLLLNLGAACKPAIEKIYQQSFPLRAARELDSAGDTTGAKFYLQRASKENLARVEAQAFLRRIDARSLRAGACVDEKKTDLEINRYPRIRHKHLFQLALCLESAGEPAKALNFYNLSESAGSKQPQLYIRRAFLKEKLGDSPGMGNDLKRAVLLNPEYLPALLHRALYDLCQGKPHADEQLLARFEASRPLYAEILRDAMTNNDEFSRARKPLGNMNEKR